MAASRSLEERIVELETIVTHLERDVEQLNAAMIAQQKTIESLRQFIERLERRLDEEDEGPEVRDLRAERPPHF